MPERVGDLTCILYDCYKANSAVFLSSNNTVLRNLKNTPVLRQIPEIILNRFLKSITSKNAPIFFYLQIKYVAAQLHKAY